MIAIVSHCMHSTDFCMLIRRSFTVHSAALSNQLGGTFILSPLHQAYPPCGSDLFVNVKKVMCFERIFDYQALHLKTLHILINETSI